MFEMYLSYYVFIPPMNVIKPLRSMGIFDNYIVTKIHNYNSVTCYYSLLTCFGAFIG